MRHLHITGAIALAVSLAACGGGSKTDDDRMDKVYQLMMEEMDPAADGIWTKSGWVMTEEEGEQSLFPTTDEGWAEVAAAAENLMVVNRKLQSDEYSGGDAEWSAIADGINVFAQQAKDAALAKDEQELFDVGGDIYRVCLACHQRYIIDDEEAS